MIYSTAKPKPTLKNDSSRRVNPQPVISFPGRQQILSSSLYRGTPAKSGIIWFYCFLSNNSPSLRLGTGFVPLKWPFCSLQVVTKGQTGRKLMRPVAFCWWKVKFYPPSALSHSRDRSVEISVIPWDLPLPELLETMSTMFFLQWLNNSPLILWSLFPLPVFLQMPTVVL